MDRIGAGSRSGLAWSLVGLTMLGWLLPAWGADNSRYMTPDEIRPGMKGYGRTVMSGSKIERFDVEVIAVMRNAYYAKQDVILVRCAGLNLEHSGIIGGMSGSPCFVTDDQGRERMIGAVAYGWTFNKDPICGVQPITQMLAISEVRDPGQGTPGDSATTGEKKTATQEKPAQSSGGGVDLGDLIAKWSDAPLEKSSRLSVFNADITRALAASRSEPKDSEQQMRPLSMPVMVSGLREQTMNLLKKRFENLGLTPVVSGGASGSEKAKAAQVKLEPGSVLCIPFMTGDIMMEGLGTCTEVIGDRILGFGHSMMGEGSVELPIATGIVHTVIPSVMRSNKIGAALEPVGTLWGDESSGIFGVVGKTPPHIPLEVVVHDDRGERTYKYDLVQERFFTPTLLGVGVMESLFAHSDLPKEHTLRYKIETEFEGLGTFRTSNMTSQTGVGVLATEATLPAMALMNAPFGRSKVKRARVDVTVEKGACVAMIDQVNLPRTTYKPGETVTASVRWMHEFREPVYSQANYELKLPDDLPDGDYELTLCGSSGHLAALRTEKPHLFRSDSPQDLLRSFNFFASFADNALYIRLSLPSGGVAVDDTELPELPSFQRHILLSAKRSDVHRYSNALTVQHATDFAVSGAKNFKIKVNRRADQ